MRRALVAAVLLVIGLVASVSPVLAGFSLVTHVGAQSTDQSAVTTSGVDTTGATLLIASVAWVYNGTQTLTDSKSNTWTALNNYNASPQCQVQLFYVVNPTVGTGHTFTVSGSTIYPAVTVTAWTGQAASPVDQQNGNTASATTIATGSVTPSQGNELLIATTCHNNAYASSIDSQFTISDDDQGANGLAYGNVMAYIVQGATPLTVNPTFSGNGLSNVWAAAIATFTAAAGGGARPCVIGGGFFGGGGGCI